MKVRYIEHHPDEWLVGVAGLTPEQNGIYRTVCDLIASTGGPIPVDDERLFRIVKAKRNRIKRVITELLVGHKLTLTGSQLGNNRVITELERAHKRSITGQERAAKRWNINPLGDAPSNGTRVKLNQEPIINQEPIQESPQRRASRLPADFKVPQEWKDKGAEIRNADGLSPINLDSQANHFVDYWHAKAGKDGCKLDWEATWRNWCRTARAPTVEPTTKPNGHDLSFYDGPTEPAPKIEGFPVRVGRPH
jgi:uncharacterized protein YdaU (DUF1376 family)